MQKERFVRMTALAFAAQLACLAAGAAYAADEPAKDEATAKPTVIITGKKIGMGLMVTEDAPKARSTITAEELEKQRATGNAYEALEMLPAVNSYNQDSTGLFGGGLTLRGFNSDQIGATINGVPVNDSGNFAVFPQEYVDQENTCSEFVTQGSTDVDSPQVGATGGNFGIITCKPEDAQRIRVMQTLGQLHMGKTFVRFDSGLWDDKREKMFISFSNATANKWKGYGGARRDHIDAGYNYNWDRFNYISATVLWNRALNNNIENPTLAELAKNGYYFEFSPVPATSIHQAPVGGKAQTDVLPSPAQYYTLSANPFQNAIFSAPSRFRLNDNLDVKFTPYMWYGYGNGGIEQLLMTESAFLNPTTGKNTAGVDLNGDGDTLDKVIVYRSSVTKTYRPGANLNFVYTTGDHEILAGWWGEKARHEQTQPMTHVWDTGLPQDYFLAPESRIRRPDGHYYEGRDTLTLSTAHQFSIQDTWSFDDNKGQLNFGLRNPKITRDVTVYENEGSVTSKGTFPTYNMVRDYSAVLPQFGARYRVTNDDQFFTSIAKNMKAPPNFVFSNFNTNVYLVNGVPTLRDGVKEETSVSTDIGYRHQDKAFIFTATAFFTNFKDRQVSYFDPVASASYYYNVGNVKNRGFEIEYNNMPIHGWSLYGSLGYLKTELQNDIAAPSAFDSTKSVTLPARGKEMPNAPRWKAGLSVEYSEGAFWARLKARSTARQYATIINDEYVGGYTTFGFDAGYTMANFGIVKRPKFNLNISNLTSKQYMNPSSTGNLNSQAYTINGVTTSTSAPRYYLGAPRFISASMSVDF